MAQHPQRTLAVILHADIVGSTELVQRNETLAHERIRDAFQRLSTTIRDYAGKPHELRGDALVAEFERASDAVSAALAFQADNAAANRAIEDDIQPRVRIGISLGEVVIADGTLTGAGVVLAQRVEQLAEPDGVCITGAIHEAMPQHLPFEHTDIGRREVKGFAEPIQVYRTALRADATVSPQPSVARRQTWRSLAIGGATLAVVVAAVLAWLQPWVVREEPASIERMAFPLPDKPSVAVLPFDNLSGDPEQEFFADGITNDIITDLSRFGDLVVIAAHSTFVYKGRPVKVQKVAEDLGVRYIVEGSIQKSGDQVRINAQFIDAITGEHLWAERYVRRLDDLFTLQDDITQKIVTSLGSFSGQVAEVTLARAKRKNTTDLTAYEHFMLGLETVQRFNREDNTKARALFERAIDRDPRYARAYAFLAWTHFFDWQRGWSKSEELSAALAFDTARTAVELDEFEPEAHWILMYVNAWIREKPQEAIAGANRALALNPNHADILADWGGFVMPFLTGKTEEGIKLVEKAMRLNPYHADWYEQALGGALYIAGRYEEAIATLRKVVYHGQESRLALAASYAQLGRLEEARIEVAKLLELQPGFSIERLTAKIYFRNPDDLAHYLDGVRKAGLPEKPPLALPDKPSIAVLPIENLSGQPDQEYFAAGLTEDLITVLSKVPELLVVARNSSDSYKGKSIDVREVTRELGVRHLLQGSVQKSGEKLRITAQLIDGDSGAYIWSERYDREVAELFDMQDEIVRNVLIELQVKLTVGETARILSRGTRNLEAWILNTQALAAGFKFTPEGMIRARELYAAAVEADPAWAHPVGGLAWTHYEFLRRGWSKSVEEDRKRGMELARKAIEMDPDEPLGYMQLGNLYIQKGDFEKGIELRERALELSPSNFFAMVGLAWRLPFVGREKRALELYERARTISPLFPWWLPSGEGLALHVDGQLERAIDAYHESLAMSDQAIVRGRLAAVYADLDRLDEATEQVRIIKEMKPDANAEYFLRVLRFQDPNRTQWYADLLAKAGIPE